MSKILYIDMDGVVADFDGYMEKVLPNVELGEGDPNTYADRSAMVDKAAKEDPTFFERLDVIKDALWAVEELKSSNKYDIYFLSTPMFNIPKSYMGKRVWIKKYFGSWADKRLILTHRKDLCIGDYLVDDTTRNGAGEFKGEHIHFATPKFPNWEAVIKYLV
jgi:5'-nucleotidase